ncbi:MAG: hypothetical protein HY301_16555 [Verrucomicrobia bacterium]|nr:hypothetical protein [Verrucomicrobiota bacterium]
MRDLGKFLDNPFDDDGISMDELIAFSSDHREKMIASNPANELDARIAATTSALTLVNTMFTEDSVKLGIRKGNKQAMRAFRKGLAPKTGKVHAGVVARYGADDPKVTEIYPRGLSIFGSCTDDALKDELQTTILGITAHVADLGAPLLAEAQAIRTGWMAVYSPSESSGPAKTASEAAKQEARNNLQLMLFLNLLTLAMMFPRQPEKLPLYMRQSLLEDHPHHPAPPAPPPPTPPGP